MSEIAVVSSRKTRLRQRADSDNQGARAALEIAESPDRSLSIVQIGITLVGIFAGAIGGATLATAVAVQVASVSVLAPYSQAVGLGAVVIVITYLSLITGELVPNRMTLNNPEGIIALVARLINLLFRLAALVVSLLTFSTTVALKILRVKPSDEPAVTEEVRAMISHSAAKAAKDEIGFSKTVRNWVLKHHERKQRAAESARRLLGTFAPFTDTV